MLKSNIDNDIFTFGLNLRESNTKYLYSEVAGFLDMVHFFAAAFTSALIKNSNPYLKDDEVLEQTAFLGYNVEWLQFIFDDQSNWDPEDPFSNSAGAEFGLTLGNISQSFLIDDDFIQKFETYASTLNILDANDPSIARDKLFIPETRNDPIKLPDRHPSKLGKSVPCINCPYWGEDRDFGK